MNLFLFSLFLFLALIHVNWALGGKWGFVNALPSHPDGKLVMTPGRWASALVGCGLLLFGLFYLYQTGFLPLILPQSMVTLISWLIPAVFLMRAVGEFRYVGFFKKIRNTGFAKMDTRFYTPLCLGIGMLGVLLALK